MAFISESASVADLRSNPLMLALLCILYRGAGSLPRNRTEVYEQCASMLYPQVGCQAPDRPRPAGLSA